MRYRYSTTRERVSALCSFMSLIEVTIENQDVVIAFRMA